MLSPDDGAEVITPDIQPELMPDIDAEIATKQLEAPSIFDRFTSGMREAGSTLRTNILNPAEEALGLLTPEERVARDKTATDLMDESMAVDKQYIDAKGEDAWNVAGGLGKYSPDLIAGGATKAKALGTGVMDFGLEYSRTGDIKKSMAAGVLGATGYKVLDAATKKLAKPVKNAFGKAIDAMGSDTKKAMNAALKTMDDLGIKRMDEGAREKLVSEIDLTKSTKEVSQQVTERLTQQRGRAKNIKNNEYAKADELAGTTNQTDILDLLPSVRVDDKGKVLDIKNMTAGEKVAYKEIKKKMERGTSLTAEGLEAVIKDLNNAGFKPANSSEKYLYDRAVKSLKAKQEELLNEKGLSGVYDTARAADQEYKRRYFGSIDGYGSKAGAKVNSVLKAQDNSDVATSILGDKFDKNIAEQVSREFGKTTRQDMVMDVLSKNVDNLDTPIGIGKFIDNFEKANTEGMIHLLGKENHATLTKNIDALKLVESTIIERNKGSEGIIKNVISLLGAAMASKISPYASMHVAINESKNIANKALAKKSKDGLIKTVNGIEDKHLRRTLLNAIKMVNTPAATITADKTKVSEMLDGIGTDANASDISDTSNLSNMLKNNPQVIPQNIIDERPKEYKQVFDINNTKPTPFNLK